MSEFELNLFSFFSDNLDMVQGISIRKKLVLAVFLISTLATTVAVVVGMAVTYRIEMSQFENVMTSIEVQNIDTLSKLCWDLNLSQIQYQLDSIVKLPEIVQAKIVLNDSSEKLSAARAGDLPSDVLEKRYALVYKSNNSENKLGELSLVFDHQMVVDKVLSTLLMTILINFIKAAIISVSLYFVFQYLVTRRIEQMCLEVSKVLNDNFKSFYNPQSQRQRTGFFFRWDEINRLEHQIRRMSKMATKGFENMESQIAEKSEELEVQRAKAMYSSKMATLGEMAAGIAHEINNPLAIINTRLQLLDKHLRSKLENYDDETALPPFKMEVTKLKALSDRIEKIVKGLKFFARDSSEAPMEWVNFKSIVEDTIQLMNQKIKRNQIDLQYNIEDVELYCRPIEISQVVVNLVTNALDAIAPHDVRWIRINSKLNSENMVIRISDSGFGIPTEIQEKIMQPFFTTKPIGQGTGLGLSISKGIIESHGGSLIYLNDDGHTCFQITLPAEHVRVSEELAS